MTAHPALDSFRAALAAGGRVVPGFDPADGGAGARLLVLLETPGPGMTGADTVSRDNPTGTGRNLTRFLAEAGIGRADTVLWNAVPWVIHAPGARNRTPRRAEIDTGIALLPPLLARLPALRAVVLAGRVAGLARDTVAAARPDVALLPVPHPSPTIVCTSPDVAARIRAGLAAAAALLYAGAGDGTGGARADVGAD